MSARASIAVALCLATVATLAVVAHAAPRGASAGPPPAAVRCSNTAPPPRVGGKPLDLTGVYLWPPDRGRWYVRQSGTCVYQLGQNSAGPNDPNPTGRGFTNVFVGGLSADLAISGLWSDVPYGVVEGHGAITFKVSTAGGRLGLVVLRSTGGAGVDRIVRLRRVAVQG